MARASRMGLRIASKPDSQDVCFISSGVGRRRFLAERTNLHPGSLVDVATGTRVGQVSALELVTVGQRKGLGAGPGGRRRYVLSVDPAEGKAVVGTRDDLLTQEVSISDLSWMDEPVPSGAVVAAQSSAHGAPGDAVYEEGKVHFFEPRPRVAPGQTVALYEGDRVLGAGRAT